MEEAPFAEEQEEALAEAVVGLEKRRLVAAAEAVVELEKRRTIPELEQRKSGVTTTVQIGRWRKGKSLIL